MNVIATSIPDLLITEHERCIAWNDPAIGIQWLLASAPSLSAKDQQGLRLVLAVRPLALLTEGLQFFAIDRHPRLIDVGIDLAGTVLALALVKGRNLCSARARPTSAQDAV
jgi:VanZ family protein